MHALMDHTLGEADALSLSFAHSPAMPAREWKKSTEVVVDCYDESFLLTEDT